MGFADLPVLRRYLAQTMMVIDDTLKHASSMHVSMHEAAHPAAIGSRINLNNQEAER